MAANWRGLATVCFPPLAFAARHCDMACMIELLRTNDAVLISYVEALLRDSGIEHFVADQNMSILDGSIGILPRRVLVDAERHDQACKLMQDAGLGNNLK
jgi:Putative prokaryotic signal transducing protein